MTRTLHLVESELLSRISAVLENVPEVYLVGGAVRDALLGKPVHDLDFVLTGDVRPIARRVADSLNAAYYMLDEQRSTARVIFHRRPQAPVVIDFATLRAPDLDGDLRARDFTINAMAHSLGGGGQLIDPLGGVADLRAKTLRACSASTFEDDPVRILRGVRLGLDLQFQIPSQTSQAMRRAVPALQQISPERLRDELFRMLAGARPAVAIRLLDRLGVIAILLPELAGLKQVQQPSPTQMDVWQHTLATVGALEKLFEIASGSFDDDAVVSPYLGMAAAYLARFCNHFSHEYAVALNPHRCARSLLFMAALYHDVGKPAAMSADDSGTIHFYNHESIGAELALTRAQTLALSQVEALRIASIIRNHMRVHSLLEAGDKASRRAIYRFFRDTGAAGVDVCLLSLADTLATHGHELSRERWQLELELTSDLLHAWWEKPHELVRPTPLLNGSDLLKQLELLPGPTIGMLLSELAEAQAGGEITTPSEALVLARNLLQRYGG